MGESELCSLQGATIAGLCTIVAAGVKHIRSLYRDDDGVDVRMGTVSGM